jgi:hypothetical protein
MSFVFHTSLCCFFPPSHFKLLQTLKPIISKADSCEEEIQIYPNEIDPSWGGALRSLIGRN